MKPIVKKIRLVFLCFILLFLPAATVFAAPKDNKSPEITLSVSTKEATNEPVKVTVKVTDSSQIKLVKWAKGTQKSAYFKKNGTKLSLTSKGKASVTIEENGSYTFYAKDMAGNTRVKKLSIKNIDISKPEITIKKSTAKDTNKNITLNITVNEDGSGIHSVKYLSGIKETKDFKNSGTKLSLDSKGNGKITVKKNGSFTIFAKDAAGNASIKTVKVTNIDKAAPSLKPSYTVMNQKASIKINGKDSDSGIASVMYLKGTYKADSDKWDSAGNVVKNLKSFTVSAAGKYSIRIEDNAGNQTVSSLNVIMELRAVWISYLEFSKSKGYSESKFKQYIDKIYDDCVDMNMNTVIVQVRPYGDAMYESDYFPWSSYASGTQGKNPGYDPLDYMVKAAHKRNLSVQAWVNPYRITADSTKVSSLSEDNQARIWREDPDTERYVLSFGGKLYYNPAIKEVQDLIVDGVREIVKKYDVDGIHFDDYFYPSLGSNYKKNFDYKEYNQYKAQCEEAGKSPKSIADWRRSNVNTMVKKVYSAVKGIDDNCVFGISPAGNISNLLSDSGNYVDIKTWLASSEYVDYICPQIYWSFEHPTAPYKTVLKQWVSIKKSNTINLYVGLAAYRAGITESQAKSYGDISWSKSNTILKRQVQYGRNTGIVDGYMFFRYEQMIASNTKKEMQNVISIFN